jgi:hypothetical protein
MARSIKITADTAQLKKSITDFSKTIEKSLGKSKIDLFTQADSLKKKLDGIKESTTKHMKALEGVVKGSREELVLRNKILKASQEVLDTEKQRQEVMATTNAMQQSAFSRQFSKMSGLSSMMKGLKGIGGEGGGMMGMAGGLAGTAAIAALAYGGSRVMAGRNTWKEGVADRLSLMGRGETNLEPQNPKAMANAGLDAQSMRAQRMQAMDVFGREGATEKSVVQRAGFERAFGVDQGTMTGIGAGLRPSMGGAQANATVMKLQASLIASGIKDAIGPYLETTASMLTELNEKGFTMDDSVLALFNQMTKTGMGEGRIKQLSMGVDQSIRGSTGESNAFYQSAFNKAGIGGGTIGGAQAAMRMGGLFGADLDKYKGMSGSDKKMFQSMGIGGPNSMQKVSGAILGQMDQIFKGQKGSQNRLSRLRYIMSTGMAKDEGQASEVEGLLKRAKSATPAEQQKIMKQLNNIQDENKDPSLSELKKINSSTAGIYDVLQKTSKTQLDQLGEVTGGVFNDMDKLLTSIDGAILSIAKLITGYETPEEEKASRKSNSEEAMAAAKKGQLQDSGQINSLKSLSAKDQTDLYREIKQKADMEDQKNFLTKNNTYQRILDSGALDVGEGQAKREDYRKAHPKGGEAQQVPFINDMLKAMNQVSRNTKDTAHNTKNVGIPASSASTTGTQ